MGIRAGYLISGLRFGKNDTGNLLQNTGRNSLMQLSTILRKISYFCVPFLSPLDVYNPTNKRNMYLP